MANKRAGKHGGGQAPARRDRSGSRAGSGGGYGRMLLGFLLGAALVLFAGYVYFERPAWVWSLRSPHTTARDADQDLDTGLPIDPATNSRPRARTGEPHPAPKPATVAPFGASEDVFEAGARVYRAQCARCHGTPGKELAAAALPAPEAPGLNLWRARGGHDGRVGVTGRPVSEIYDSITGGTTRTGTTTPGHASSQKLSCTQIWQVTLLLEHAGDPDGLPDPVRRILETPTP